MAVKENAINWDSEKPYATVYFEIQSWINKITRMAEANEEFKIIATNTDGSILARIPKKCVKIHLPRQMSEEARKAAGERMRKMQTKN
ncbi:hypothetical protein [Pygmaiobacter massiliensis]|uniref:hypothetical protein n=1 Tax=Pygmaiobacter massiliensis TaxID=1917873 RepID=UPI000C7D1DE9|nr:hypothetical protein [Pygmaiobacter massiliensis]